jgi:hypothetical protein
MKPMESKSSEIDGVAHTEVPAGTEKRVARAPAPASSEDATPSSPAPASTGSTSTDSAPNTAPTGASYVAARWVELNDPASPWWTRSHGMGIRLRLKELLDMADAQSAGAALEDRVRETLEETEEALLEESPFLWKRYSPIAERLKTALGGGHLSPSSRNYSIIQAALEELRDSNYPNAIIEELCLEASAGAGHKKLGKLDSLVELLDGEIAFEKHPVEWRFEVAKRCQAAVDEAKSLKEAIEGALRDAKKGWPKTVRVLVPVRQVVKPPDGEISRLQDDVGKQLQAWLRGRPVPDGFKLDELTLEFNIEEAADEFAAIRRASEWLEQERAFYALQGGELEALGPWLAIPEASGPLWLAEAPAPLRLLPDGVELGTIISIDPSTRPTKEDEDGSILPDAVIQLAQARRGSDGAALSDIWTVVEAVFGGSVNDRGYLASEAVSNLLEYLYPVALLDWMGRCLEREGLEKGKDLSYAGWALDEFGGANSAAAFAVAQSGKDPLLYVRSKTFGEWAPSKGEHEHLEAELDAVKKRCSHVCRRAYLVRNFHVHKAQPYRATALAATLPIFSEMTREALGHVAKQRFRDQSPLTVSETAAARIRQLASEFRSGRQFGAKPLRAAIGEDLLRSPRRRGG